MGVDRDDVDLNRIDFSEVRTGDRLPAVAPGEILKAEFLEPLGLSIYALARATRVSRSRLNDIVLGRRAVSADTALRLARYFGTTPQFWLRLQSTYELEVAEATLAERINAEVTPRAA